MAFRRVSLIISFVICSMIQELAADCYDIPDFARAQKCCFAPKMGNRSGSIDCYQKFMYSGESFVMIKCKIAECFMNDMQLAKFNDIDKNEVLNYIVEAPNDAAWKQIYGNAFEQCYNDINVRFSEVVTLFEFPPFNIRRDQCNVKFMALLMCIKHKVLSSCPIMNLVNDLDCLALRKYSEQVGDPFMLLLMIQSTK